MTRQRLPGAQHMHPGEGFGYMQHMDLCSIVQMGGVELQHGHESAPEAHAYSGPVHAVDARIGAPCLPARQMGAA
jgi:hypothetical protein